MSTRTIGLVDYGVGNLASVTQTLLALGYRCRVSADPAVLDLTDLLLLPGVGAFPPAMAALQERGLVGYLRNHARRGRPMVGICLGMQLLADGSEEHCFTAGLGLIPGNVRALSSERWHIGWNSVEVLRSDPLLKRSDGHSMYFNHSFVFEPAPEYAVALARLSQPFTVAVRRDNIVGLQFHPEKSQIAGRQLLSDVIEGLCSD
jgi:glutamine amidotransferase